jgi:hypothetical protein
VKSIDLVGFVAVRRSTEENLGDALHSRKKNFHYFLGGGKGLFYRGSGLDAQHDGQHLGGGMDDMNLPLP